jgi:hypothetical protein
MTATRSRSAKCGVCDRATAPAVVPRGRLLLCGRCAGLSVHIRTAREERLGARTFYVDPLGTPSALRLAYNVKRFARRMTCDCPDFTHRGQVLGVPCKHIRLVRLFIRAQGGISRVPMGADVRFRLAIPAGRQQSTTSSQRRSQ